MPTLATEDVGAGSGGTVNDPGQPPATGTQPGRKVVLRGGAGALAVGGILGWMAATSPGIPSYNYAGAVAGFWALLFLLGIVTIAVFGLLALRFRSSWLAIAFVVGGGCLLGLVGGAWLTRAAGLGYRYTWPSMSFPTPSAYRFASGDGLARLTGVAGFTTRVGAADCISGPSSLDVATVNARDMGALGDATLRGDLHLHVAGVDPNTVAVSVYLWSSSMTAPGSRWQGQGRLVTVEPSVGRVSFAHIARVTGDVTGDQAAAGAWPAELSGEISWSCGPWSTWPITRGP